MVRLRTIVLLAMASAAALRVSAQRRRPPGRQVVVSAAVSLTDVLQQLAPMYQQATGDQLVLNLGASNTLARQIRFEAGVDVFISADAAQMDTVAMQIDTASRVDVLSNQLAIAVPDDRSRTMTSGREPRPPAL